MKNILLLKRDVVLLLILGVAVFFSVLCNGPVVLAAEDTTPPNIDVATLSVDKTAAIAGDKVKISVKVTDDQSGIKAVAVVYHSPVSKTDVNLELTDNIETDRYEGEISIAEGTENGLWQIDNLTASDGSSAENKSTIANSKIYEAVGDTTLMDLSAGDFSVAAASIPVTEIALDKETISFDGINQTQQLTAVITPENATNKNIKWSSDQEAIATVDETGKVTAKGFGTATITATTEDGAKAAQCAVKVEGVSVKYKTHVENDGWQGFVYDGDVSGTTGKALRLEAINIEVSGDTNLGIKYATHVEDIGWQDFVENGDLSGTTAQSKRLEAIKIELTGVDADLYDIYYRVHAEDYGWLDWAKNGEAAGTEGLAKRLEAINIKIVPKGTDIGESTDRPFVSKYGIGSISYRSHVQDIGWQDYVTDGVTSGTIGESKRVEAINIRLGTNMPSGSIEYSTHVRDYGWMGFVKNGELSGTTGESKRVEAIQIRLTGDIAEQYDIYYRTFVLGVDWLGWAKNGESAGSAGYSAPMEAIEIKIVEKGGPAPGDTANHFLQKL